MTKHTPGPWLFDEESGAITTHKRIAKGIARIVTVRLGWAEPFESEQIANARLIAAAPDLLEALCMVLDDPDALDGRPRTYECVREAIAKATKDKP